MTLKKIFKNIKLNMLITIFTGILSFVSNRYFSDYMGIDTLGLMRLFSQLVAYLSLAELGIEMASTYALHKPLVEKDNERVSVVVSTIDYFHKKIATFIFITGILLNFIVPFFIKENIYGNLLYLYWSLYVTNTAMGYLFAKYSILFIADQKYSFVRKVQGSSKILFQVFQIIFLVRFQSFALFIIIMMLENIYNFYFFHKHYKLNYGEIKIVKERDTKILKNIKDTFWHRTGEIIVLNTDYIILSRFTSLAVVGIYSSYFIIYQMVLTLVNIGTPVIAPVIGKFVAENFEDKNKIYLYWKKIYIFYMLMSTIVIMCAYILKLPFVNLWLGDDYLLPRKTIILILINLFIHTTRAPIELFKESSGFFDDTYAPMIETTINLIFSLALVQRFGLNGVIMGTIASNLIAILFLKPILTFKRCFNKSGVDYLKDFFNNFILVGIVFIICKTLFLKFNNFLNFESWLAFAISAVAVGIIISIISIAVFAMSKDFREMIPFKLSMK